MTARRNSRKTTGSQRRKAPARKKTTGRKPASKKTTRRKVVSRSAGAKKAVRRKAASRAGAAKKAAGRKAVSRKAAAKKTSSRATPKASAPKQAALRKASVRRQAARRMSRAAGQLEASSMWTALPMQLVGLTNAVVDTLPSPVARVARWAAPTVLRPGLSALSGLSWILRESPLPKTRIHLPGWGG